MAGEWRITAFKRILELTTLIDVERTLLTNLLDAAERGVFVDTISRMQSHPDAPFTILVMANVKQKCIDAGIQTELESLRDREAHDLQAEV